MESAVSL